MWLKTVALAVVAIVIGSNSVTYCGIVPLKPVGKNVTSVFQAEKTRTSNVTQTTKATPQNIPLNSTKSAASGTAGIINTVPSVPTREAMWNPSTEMAAMTPTDASFHTFSMTSNNGFAGNGNMALLNTTTEASFSLHEVLVLNDVLV
ncbi:hypothetical protein ACJMK2_026293 [Sinanodonta woodiana]|uniref:Secreted protein n=1 Tax=Sinanodonta woodiana TaxID=1069815 RepID=A0ABD3XKX7_SINWO